MNVSGVSAGKRVHRSARRSSLATPNARNSSSFCAQPGQARRRRVRARKFARMRIEGEHGRRQAQVVGGFAKPREHRLMAAMDTVEIADRQRDRFIARAPEVRDISACCVGRGNARRELDAPRKHVKPEA